ncbi:hypothetical protein [Janibacter sp. GXQ6167]|uniref:hypothetical protein n=1 Tax=Janibacter sp. GXQ6167 TaxID=3240791 RepID=UPI0035266498
MTAPPEETPASSAATSSAAWISGWDPPESHEAPAPESPDAPPPPRGAFPLPSIPPPADLAPDPEPEPVREEEPETVPEPAPAPAADHDTPAGEVPMTDYNASLADAMQIEGALGVALVDAGSGMALATAGSPVGIDLEVAAAGNSSVVQAKLRTMRDLGLNDKIEDILITLDSQFHIIRTLGKEDGMFLYLVLDKGRANLAMARFRLGRIEKDLHL